MTAHHEPREPQRPYWAEEDDVPSLDPDSDGPDEDYPLGCGCIVARNHGHWDPELTTTCPNHTLTQAVTLAANA